MQKNSLLVQLCVPLVVLIDLPAKADLPLLVETLTTDKNNFVLSTNITYQNQNETEHYQYPSIDELVKNSKVSTKQHLLKNYNNTDTVTGNVGLTYGVSDKLEIGIETSASYQQNRSINSLGEINKVNSKNIQGIDLTGQYQLTKNHKLLKNSTLNGRISLVDKTKGLKQKTLSSASIGATITNTNDPVLLSISGDYTYNGKRKLDKEDIEIDVGDNVSVTGAVGVAINPDITLTTGVNWRAKQADKINGKKIDTLNTHTGVSIGMGYGLSERNTFRANVSKDISGEGGSTVSIGLNTKLGELPPPLSEKYKQYRQKKEIKP